MALRTIPFAVSDDEETLLKLHGLTIQLVDRIGEEARSNRSLWSSFKLADQESLRSEVFEVIMASGLPLVGLKDAERLADALMQQAKANQDSLREI